MLEGPAADLPMPMSRDSAMFERESGPGTNFGMRGYGPLIRFCTFHGESADGLAADPERLVRFLRAFGAEIGGEPGIRAAAAVFVGNAIAGLRADAQWTAYEGDFPSVGNGEQQFQVHRLLDALQRADDEMVRRLVSALTDWAREVLDDSPVRQPLPTRGRDSPAISDRPCRR